MYYIKSLIFLTIFLGGCAVISTQEPSEDPPADNTIEPETSSEAVALYRQGITELHNGQLTQAEMSFLRMAKLQPELAGPWANLALLYIKQAQYDKAEKHIHTALMKNPAMPQALNLAGYLENRKGHIKKAKELYEKAIANKPDYALAHYNLALLYDVYFQDLPKAIEHYQRYLSLIKHEDKQTRDWVDELKRNVEDDKV